MLYQDRNQLDDVICSVPSVTAPAERPGLYGLRAEIGFWNEDVEVAYRPQTGSEQHGRGAGISDRAKGDTAPSI